MGAQLDKGCNVIGHFMRASDIAGEIQTQDAVGPCEELELRAILSRVTFHLVQELERAWGVEIVLDGGPEIISPGIRYGP
jgi:hypothetical protein